MKGLNPSAAAFVPGGWSRSRVEHEQDPSQLWMLEYLQNTTLGSVIKGGSRAGNSDSARASGARRGAGPRDRRDTERPWRRGKGGAEAASTSTPVSATAVCATVVSEIAVSERAVESVVSSGDAMASFKDVLSKPSAPVLLGDLLDGRAATAPAGWVLCEPTRRPVPAEAAVDAAMASPVVIAKASHPPQPHRANAVSLSTAPDPSAVSKLQDHWFRLASSTSAAACSSVATPDTTMHNPPYETAWVCTPPVHPRATLNTHSPSSIVHSLADLELAISTCDDNRLRVILNSALDCDDEQCDGANMHMLHIAASSGNALAVSLLLERGCDADVRHKTTKQTPLHMACESGSIECVRILLEHGALIDSIDKHGDTVLHKCVNVPFAAPLIALLCERLKKTKLSVNGVNKSCQSALMLCRVRDNAFTLLSFGADPLQVDRDGFDCISRAASRGDELLLETLLYVPRKANSVSARKIAPARGQDKARHPLIEAAKAGRVSMIEPLIDYGFSIDCMDSEHMTPLMHAVRCGDVACLTAILRCNADVFIEDLQSFNVFVYACCSSSTKILETLLARCSGVTRLNSYRETVLEASLRFLSLAGHGKERVLQSVPLILSAGVEISKAFLDALLIRRTRVDEVTVPTTGSTASIDTARIDSLDLDVVFRLAENEELLANMQLCIVESPVLFDLLVNDTSNAANGDSRRIVHLPHFSGRFFQLVLSYFHTNRDVVADESCIEVIVEVLDIAEFLQIDRLATLCKRRVSYLGFVYHDDKQQQHNIKIPSKALEIMRKSTAFAVENRQQCLTLPFPRVAKSDSLLYNSTLINRVTSQLYNSRIEIEIVDSDGLCRVRNNHVLHSIRDLVYDVVFVCEGVHLQCHTTVVSYGKLQSMIHFHRCTTVRAFPSLVMISIDDIPLKQFKDMLHFLYFDWIESFDLQSTNRTDDCVLYVLDLMIFANYYLILSLSARCEAYISNNLTPATAFAIFDTASVLGLTALAVKSAYIFLTKSTRAHYSADVMQVLEFLLQSIQ